MRSSSHYDILVHLYPAVYGIALLFAINRLFNSFINSLFYPTKLSAITRLVEVLEIAINNMHLVLIVFLLVFAEAIRVVIIGAKILVLVEALLLFIYCWSIEITIVYLALSYPCTKIVQGFIPKQERRDSEASMMKQITVAPSHSSSSTTLPGYDNNLLLIIVGLCIGVHVLYSYFLVLNFLSMIIYIAVVAIAINKVLKHHKNEHQVTDFLLAIIPPFGVVPALYKVFFTS